MKKEFIERIKKTILQNALITPGDSVLVAVSGGADSVCLLDVLHALKEEFSLSLFAAHLNHMLRGKEADRDEAFVRGLCAQYGIPFHSERVDVSHMAKTNKMTCEEAGRKARYDFFLRLKTKYKINKIATAHNKNDNVETVCMRFLRGTGIDGLAGIPIINDLNVIRPLLHASRQEIEAYLEERGISYITDSSNLSDDYMRNQIRHHLLPDILEHYNENFIETLSNNILLYSDAGRLLSKQVEIAFEKLAAKHHYGFRFNLSDLLKNDVYIIKSLIKKSIVELINKDATGKTVQLIYENVVLGDGTSFTVNPFLTIYKKYNQLYFVTKKSMPEFSYVNDGSGEILILETGDKIKFYLF